MRRPFRFTPAWLVVGFLALPGCGDKSPKQAVAKEPEPPIATPVVESPSVNSQPVTFESADSSFRAGRYGEALERFTRYAVGRPMNPWGFYMLGLSAWKAGDLAKAEDAFKQALTLDSTHVKSYLNLSRVLIESGRPDSAVDFLNAVLRIDESVGEAYRLMGRVHDAKGEPDQAITDYREALTFDSTDVWSMNNLGLVLIHQGAFDEALRPLARAALVAPRVATFQNNLGMALERTGHFVAAAEAYRSALHADSGFTKASTNLARVSGQREDPNTPPVNLTMLSQEFSRQIAGWRNGGEE